MKEYVTVSVVSFHSEWGRLEINRKRLIEYTECLARRGSNIIVFPELALNGYSYDENNCMQKETAEPVPGATTMAIGQITQKYKTYVAFGMVEAGEEGNLYNSVAICGPHGYMGKYRKIHLPLDESKWASAGNWPFMFETEWGPVGVSICYDTYLFPEIMRYYKAKGARILLNCTATCHENKRVALMNSLWCNAATNNIYIASANPYGVDHGCVFYGRSNITGPVKTNGEAAVLAGHGFDEEYEDSETVATASFDLSTLPYHTYSHLFDKNPKVGCPDWRPQLYAEMCEDLEKNSKWKIEL